MAEGHGGSRAGRRVGRSKLLIRALALGVLAALAAGAALAADRGACRYIGYDGYAGTSRCDKRARPVIDLGSSTGRKGGTLELSAQRTVNAEEVVWDLDGDGDYQEAAGNKTPVVALSSAGPQTIGLKVTDPHGRSATAQRTINVHDGNVAPEVSVYPDDDDTVAVGQPYSLGWTARDPDDTTLSVTVDFGDGAVKNFTFGPDDELPELTHPYTSPGEKTITVSANDGNLITSLQYTMEIGATAGQLDPRIDYPTVRPPRAGRQVTLTEWARDPDFAGPLNWAWDLNGDGDYDDGAADVVNHTFAAGAQATYGLQITDANGDQTTIRKTVTPTSVNVGPQASITVEPEEPKAGVPAWVFVYGFDSDSDDVEIAYDLDGDGNFDNGSGRNDFQHTFPTPGTYSVAIRVTDADGAVAIHRTDVVVATAVPKGDFTWSPRRPDPGTPITFTGTGTDPDGTTVALEWDLDADVHWNDATGTTATMTFASKGWHPVSLRIRDAAGDVKVVTHYIPVGDVINHNPTAGFTVSPAAPQAGDTVTFTSTATDPDGDALKYWWELDGDDGYDDGSAATATRTFAAAGTYRVVLYVVDSRGGWDEVSGTVTVAAAQAGGGVITPPTDTTAPTLKLNPIAKKALKLGTIRTKGLKVPVGCSETCTASLELGIDKKTAKKLKLGKKAVVVGKVTGQVGASGTLTIKLTNKAKKAMKKAKTVKVTLRGKARDAAGNTSVLPSKILTLKK